MCPDLGYKATSTSIDELQKKSSSDPKSYIHSLNSWIEYEKPIYINGLFVFTCCMRLKIFTREKVLFKEMSFDVWSFCLDFRKSMRPKAFHTDICCIIYWMNYPLKLPDRLVRSNGTIITFGLVKNEIHLFDVHHILERYFLFPKESYMKSPL